jgi:predicted regulator of Ras-like GTPase activity (Roadblock/LC7/MglB family)
MDPAEALAELKQISTQIDRAVISRDGVVEASTSADATTSERLARAAQRLWDAGERAGATLGRPPLVKLHVGLPDGCVFAVRDGQRLIVATTQADPPVGLVLYDLKDCLRGIAAVPEEQA